MKPNLILLALLVSHLLLPAALTAQVAECVDYSGYPHWVAQLTTRVPAKDLIVAGDLAYLATMTGGVVIVDISDPLAPVQIGGLVGAVEPGWNATADALALADDHLFVADGYSRKVHVLDVSDPTAPFLVTQLDTGVYPRGLAVAGDYLYVAVLNDGVEIYDISDPTAPVPAGFLALGSLTMNVVVDGGLLFVNRAEFGMAVCDLTDPTAPAILSHVYRYQSDETWDVAVQGDLAYVATPGDTWIVDVADPVNAAIIGSIPQFANSLCISGNFAFLAANDLAAYDLTDPLAPVEAFYLSEPSWSPGLVWVEKAAVADGYIFTAASSAGLLVGDVDRPEKPPQTATLLPETAERMCLWGSYLLVAARTAGLVVVGLSDPASPAIVGSLASEDARAVVADGELAYLADGGDGLKIIDLHNPALPTVTGHYDTYSRVATGLALSGDLVFLAADVSDLLIIDVFPAKAPSLVSAVETPGRAQDVVLGGSYAFVAAKEEGLQVVDVSDPAAPSLAASLELPGYQEAVILNGETLFIGGDFSGVHAIDVAIPTDPVVIGWLPVEGLDLSLTNDFLYAAGYGGTTIIDCSDPTAPVMVGYLPIGENCSTAVATSDYLLAAGESLHVAPPHCRDFSATDGTPRAARNWARLAAHPNPFNPRLEIEFGLERPQAIRLEVFDLAGRRVARLADGVYSAADHRMVWEGDDPDGRALPSGCYFLLLQGENNMTSKKVVLVR